MREMPRPRSIGGDQLVTADLAASSALNFAAAAVLLHDTVAPVTRPVDLPTPDDLYVPEDLYCPADPEDPGGPRFLSEQDCWDAELDALLGRNRFSRVDALEWELWDGIEQDEAEREMLRRQAPDWVFLPPGGDLATALEELRPEVMSPMVLIELMKAATKLSSWAESIRTRATASFYRQRRAEHAEAPRPTQLDARGRPIDPERSWYGEIALAQGLSKETVGRRVATALRLTSTLSATLTALKCGALTWGKALAISEATNDLSDSTARAVEAHVLKRASRQTHQNLLKSLRTQVAKHTTREAADKYRKARAERTCKVVPLSDGMAGLWVVHTADKIQQMWTAVQAIAVLAKREGTTPNDSCVHDAPTTAGDPTTHSGSAAPATPTAIAPPTPGAPPDTASSPDSAGGAASGAHPADPARCHPPTAQPTGDRTGRMMDDRTADQRRADVMVDLFEHVLRNGLDWLGRRLPDQHRRRPHIEVIVPATTLLGLDDDPAELTGYGPIPADLARRIAADGTWRRLLTDPYDGTVVEASTTRHDPGSLVSETLLARHPVCAWPGCNRTSRDCDRDHVTPFARTGRTTLTGMAPYCEYHHVIKDTPAWGWTTTSHPDGSITLTTPTGHCYTTVPPACGPITQPGIPSRDADRPDPGQMGRDISGSGIRWEAPVPTPDPGSAPAAHPPASSPRQTRRHGAADPPPF